MNARQQERLAVAFRVLADCVKRSLVVDTFSVVLIYGRTLGPVELRWLVEAMTLVTVNVLHTAGPRGEDREIVGHLLGAQVYRIQLRKDRLAELHDVLRAAKAPVTT